MRHGLVDDQSAHGLIGILNVRHIVACLRCQQVAGIAHLPARLGIERRVVEDDFHLGACRHIADSFSV